MKNIMPYLTTIIIAGFCIAAAEHRQQWEYASLIESKSLCIWNEPSRQVDTMDGGLTENSTQARVRIYKKLGGIGDTEKIDASAVFSLVGRDGWELVAIREAGESVGYYFKRTK
jgi:hypothetical protein